MAKTKIDPDYEGRTYPWGKWFSKGRFRLKKGIDFQGRLDTMAQHVRRMAWGKDLKASIVTMDDGLTLDITVVRRS